MKKTVVLILLISSVFHCFSQSKTSATARANVSACIIRAYPCDVVKDSVKDVVSNRPCKLQNVPAPSESKPAPEEKNEISSANRISSQVPLVDKDGKKVRKHTFRLRYSRY